MSSTRNVYKVLLFITLLVVSYLVFSRPSYPQLFPNMDKVGHFGSFFILALLSYLSFIPRWFSLVAALMAYAVFIEMVQSTLSYRVASVDDVVADLVGVAIFYVCRWLYQRYSETRVKHP